jgi:hypothetical protein
MHSTTTNPSRININTTGRFRITATISFNASSVGRRTLLIRKNAAGSTGGGTFVQQDNRATPVSGSGQATVTWEESFLDTDYFECWAQDSGGSLALNDAQLSVRFVGV